jgi:hypothetical protein
VRSPALRALTENIERLITAHAKNHRLRVFVLARRDVTRGAASYAFAARNADFRLGTRKSSQEHIKT